MTKPVGNDFSLLSPQLTTCVKGRLNNLHVFNIGVVSCSFKPAFPGCFFMLERVALHTPRSLHKAHNQRSHLALVLFKTTEMEIFPTTSARVSSLSFSFSFVNMVTGHTSHIHHPLITSHTV